MRHALTIITVLALSILSGKPLFSGTNARAVIDGFTAPVTAKGELLVISGRLLDRAGNPLANARIEIWQTDSFGIYDHPGESRRDKRDRGFQFYGSSKTDIKGNYSFRTVMPGLYEPRPRHIHVKVFRDETELLTTQFYFAVDGESRGAGGSTENLRITLERITGTNGQNYYYGTFDVIVNRGSGTLSPTDSQSEGPYYPVTKVASYDNDLAGVQ